MNIRETLRGALRRLAGTGAPEKRRTLALPSILQTYGPRADVLPKPTPYNLRRFAETPVARKAINTVKDRVAGMRWRVQPKNGRSLAEIPDASERIRILTDNLDAPNSDDSFRSLAEQVLEDVIVGGFGAMEAQLSGNASRPLNLWITPSDRVGTQQRGRRPCIVMSRRTVNIGNPVVVVPMSSEIRKVNAYNILLSVTEIIKDIASTSTIVPSVALCGHVFMVDKRKFEDKLGKLSRNAVLAVQLGLSYLFDIR